MKSLGFASILVLSLTVPQSAAAQEASGAYRFLLEDDLAKYVEFAAWTDEKGNAAGQMVLTDEAKISDGEEGDGEPSEFFMKAELDSMTVEKNRAVMGGTVLDSSHKSYVGSWVQLVVEDSGDDPKEPDRLTWAFCRPREGGWIPSDSEWKDDDGAYLRWWATDAERDDDVGIPSPNLIPNNEDESGCQVHPLWSYALADISKSEGDIIVLP
jgi:hypothetical protein